MGSFTQVHIAGLPSDCEDADVEAELTKLLSAALNTAEPSAALRQCASDIVRREGIGNAVDTADAERADKADSVVGEAPVDAESMTAGVSCLTIESDPPATKAMALCRTEDKDTELEAVEEEPIWQPFTSCTVVRCKTTGNCKGYCFLGFESLQEAEAAVARINAAGHVLAAGKEAMKAQVSHPKERHAKPKEPTEDLHDLRLRRKRYQYGSKKAAIYGNKTCSDKSKTVTTKLGRVDQIMGTRGQKIMDPSADLSSRSGFATAT